MSTSPVHLFLDLQAAVRRASEQIIKRLILVLIAVAGTPHLHAATWENATTQSVAPGFTPHTDFVHVRFGDSAGESLAMAGRDSAGNPWLGLIRMQDGQLDYRQMPLPDDAVGIDAGPAQDGSDALYVLTRRGVSVLRSFSGSLDRLVDSGSMYRGRSFAEINSNLDFARALGADNAPALLIPDLDVMHVFAGNDLSQLSEIELPAVWRSFERAVTYRAAKVASAPGALIAVRGDELLTFAASQAGFSRSPRILTLPLGLSNEREVEAFYNGYEDLDQSEIVLREPEVLEDINGDGRPDLITLETISKGVFDKSSTYRIHLAREADHGVSFVAEPDTVLRSRGFQFGLRAVSTGEGSSVLVSPGLRVGVRTVIGALFSRAVTLQIALFTADDSGKFDADASTVVKARIGFDFSSGQVELPTIEFGDFDGDGRKDLLLKLKGDKLVWRRNLGAGQFDDDDETLPLPAPANGTAVHTADMNGDGRDEIVARYARADGDARRGQISVLMVERP